MKTFIEKCLDNTAHAMQIDDYVAEWHRSDSAESLHEYLGMTFNEYMRWIQEPHSLPHIINEKKLQRQ